jgi:hypothetical protein
VPLKKIRGKKQQAGATTDPTRLIFLYFDFSFATFPPPLLAMHPSLFWPPFLVNRLLPGKGAPATLDVWGQNIGRLLALHSTSICTNGGNHGLHTGVIHAILDGPASHGMGLGASNDRNNRKNVCASCEQSG